MRTVLLLVSHWYLPVSYCLSPLLSLYRSAGGIGSARLGLLRASHHVPAIGPKGAAVYLQNKRHNHTGLAALNLGLANWRTFHRTPYPRIWRGSNPFPSKRKSRLP